MSIRIVCPSCNKAYNLADNMLGKKVLCVDCRTTLSVVAPVRGERREDSRPPRDDRIASSRPASAPIPSRRDREEDQRRPVDRSRDREREEDPRRSRRPERRREDEESRGNKNMVPIFIIGGIGAVALLGMVAAGLAFALSGKDNSGNQAAAVTTEQTSAPFAAAGGPADVPPAGGAPATGALGGADKLPAGDKTDKPAGPLPAEMPANVVQQVKQSTAFLSLNVPGGVAQGSGFFAVERGIIITNAHVLGMLRPGSRAPSKVDVVIKSGEAGETKKTATVLGVDREHDLAVLRVAGDVSALPPPLPIESANKLTETQKVYIFGFPFGSRLGKNITVTTSAVSSLRRGEDGILKEVQVNGGMHPGNSGGPVTDTRGSVIGVSVAVITGTTINFAIPADFIRQVVERAKANPFDPNAPAPGIPDGPMRPGGTLQQDLVSLKGIWESGDVNAEDGSAQGTIRLHISPRAGSLGGRIQIEVIAKQGGRTSTSRLAYNFSLSQKGDNRLLVAVAAARGRRTATGIVFIYKFEGEKLVISGLIKTLRGGYNLSNVSLRRTAAAPADMPADDPTKGGTPPAPGGTGSPGAVKFTGDVFSFVQTAVKENRLADSSIGGFTLGKTAKDKYRDVCPEGGVLVGFQVGLGKFVNNVVLQSWRPIYRTKSGERFGKWQGKLSATTLTVKAKPGYVVSGMTIRAGLAIDGFILTFAKLGKDSLDLTDTYQSNQVGGSGGTSVTTIGGKGELFVGITGYLNGDKSPSSLGLVAVRAKE